MALPYRECEDVHSGDGNELLIDLSPKHLRSSPDSMESYQEPKWYYRW